MATQYLDRAALESFLGSAVLENALLSTNANIEVLIASQCAVADGYVASQVVLPPNPTAIAQVAPIVAELIYCALFINSGGPEVVNRRKAAISMLQDISVKPPRFILFAPPPVDNPMTALDESNMGADCGRGTDRWFTRRRLQEGSFFMDIDSSEDGNR